jgi:hypothetical membrane protein
VKMQAVRARTGAVLWMLCAQFFMAEQMVSRVWRDPSYSFVRNYVSDLGAARCGLHAGLMVCSPLHAWMNASFVLQGLLIFSGALLVRRVFAPWRGYSIGLGLLATSGVGVFMVGLAPEDVHAALHVAGAVAHFVGGGIAMVMLGVMMSRDARRNPIGAWLSVSVGVAVLSATALLALHGTAMWEALGWQVGIVERVAAYGIPGWVVAMGVLVTRGTRNVVFAQSS